MALEDLILRKTPDIVERCVELVCKGYDARTAAHLMKVRDAFANPVGAAIRTGVAALMEALAGRTTLPEAIASLETLVQVRAVQGFAPSDAVGFVFHARTAVREALGEELGRNGHADELAALDRKIDEIALAVFDLYSTCRERVGEVRVKEARAEADRLTRVVRAMRGTGSREEGGGSRERHKDGGR